MTVTVESLKKWCGVLLAGDSATPLSLRDYIDSIPKLESLADVPEGTPVLVRGDVDAKPGEKVGDGDIRLRSMKETLQFGRDRGWKQIIFGHIGRKPEGSLAKVAKRLGEILGCKVELIEDWLDNDTGHILDEVARQIENASPGAVFMLQNVRKYGLETALWKKKPADLANMDDVLSRLATLANEMSRKVAKVYVNEAFSAGSLDASSVIIPAAMEKVALGKYIAGEFTGPMMECLEAKLVVFSGLKADKLDDLESMMSRGKIRMVIAAGSLAMALKKADVELRGGEFKLGASENPANQDQPYFIPAKRIEQAKKIIQEGHAAGVEFVMPVDFMLGDGSIKETLGPDDQQFDIGPASSELYEHKVSEFIRDHVGTHAHPTVAFHNGVFGKFEEERFAQGTRRFMDQLKVLEDEGVHVYVGGGEGGEAVERYLGADKITHLFTAGGTVLNALGTDPVPYLVALRMAAKK